MNAQKQTAAPKATRKPAAKPLDEGVGAAKAPADKKVPKLTKAQQAAAKPAAAPAPMKLSIALGASAKDIEKVIVSIAGRGKKLDQDMHSAACASLHHVTLHGDPTLLNRLVLALPKAARRNALVLWATKFGMVALNDDAKTRAERPLVYAKGNKADIEGAQAQPFFELKNVREGGDSWLYMDFISNVMKTLERHAAEPTIDGARAKAALDSLKGVNEALTIPPNNGNQPLPVPPPGVPERRAVVH